MVSGSDRFSLCPKGYSDVQRTQGSCAAVLVSAHVLAQAAAKVLHGQCLPKRADGLFLAPTVSKAVRAITRGSMVRSRHFSFQSGKTYSWNIRLIDFK